MKKIMTYRQNMGKVKRYEILCGEQYQNVKKSELYQNNVRKCFHRFSHHRLHIKYQRNSPLLFI